MSTLLSLAGSLLALVLAAAGGGLVLLRARLGAGPIDLLVRALLGLALLAAFHVHVAVGLTLAMLIAAATWRGHNLEDAVLADARKPSAIVLGPIAIAVVVSMLRPPVPLFASESAWLGLARAISLREVIPAADRSLTLPVLTSALSLGREAVADLAIAGNVLVLAAFALFALLVARSARSSFDEALPLIVLAAAPFAWLHLRSVSVELTVGLAAASMALGVSAAGRGDRLGTPATITAALLLTMADEGIVLGVAVALAFLLTRASRDERRAALLGVVCLGLLAVAERWAAPRTGLVDFAPASLGRLVVEGVRHVTDVQTWGLVPAVGLAAFVASFRRAATDEQRTLARAIAIAITMMLLTLVLAPVGLRERALDGALLNRLALELLPLGALLIARSLPRAS